MVVVKQEVGRRQAQPSRYQVQVQVTQQRAWPSHVTSLKFISWLIGHDHLSTFGNHCLMGGAPSIRKRFFSVWAVVCVRVGVLCSKSGTFSLSRQNCTMGGSGNVAGLALSTGAEPPTPVVWIQGHEVLLKTSV